MSTVDVAVIGGGLAGLTAASQLGRFEVVVLEREARAGGRVLTREQAGVAYDLGAVFAVDLSAGGVDGPSPELRREGERVGLFTGGRLCTGQSVLECVAAQQLSAGERAALERFATAPHTTAPAELPERVYGALDSFFRLIHPGELRHYAPWRRADALFKFDTRHYVTGNRCLVEALAQPLGQRLKLGVSVLAVEERGGGVELSCVEGKRAFTVRARVAICAVPAPVARRMLRDVRPACAAFLESSTWAGGTVVAVAAWGPPPPVGYVVTPELPFNAVIAHTGRGDEPHVYLSYWVGERARSIEGLAEPELVGRTVAGLRTLGLGAFEPRQVAFTDVHRWPLVGPVISEATYGRWDEGALAASQHVILAGDYTCFEEGERMPFGTTQAMRSGQSAARRAQALL